MKTVSVVLGANFGDEGKGLMTDFLSARRGSLVVRFNGGSQAGHTVVTPGGRRHVFHHFGSGTLNHSPTHLSQHFIVNPMIFMDELRTLLLEDPMVSVDPRARVSTPWDMMLNQAAEMKRGKGRHGSCGLGIHETVVRDREISLKVMDLDKDPHKKLLAIRDYALAKADERGLDLGPAATSERLLEHFSDDIAVFIHRVRRADLFAVAYQFDGIVFEGAQGLRLDEDSPYFPHVTCSKTGIDNVLELLHEAKLDREMLNIFYCTRPYITRHGAGPLPHETEGPPYKGIEDKTNVYNKWQESIRYGRFAVEEFSTFVTMDWKKLSGIDASPQLALSCVDQLDGGLVHFIYQGDERVMPWKSFAFEVMREAGLEDAYVSSGPTRDDVRRI